MKKILFSFALLLSLCLAALSSMAQGGKPSYKVTIPGFSQITATDCALIPIGNTAGVITITKAADGKTDQQFQTDMKNKTAIATMDIIAYDGSGKQTKSFHFTGLVVKSVVANFQNISSIGLSFDTETQK